MTVTAAITPDWLHQIPIVGVEPQHGQLKSSPQLKEITFSFSFLLRHVSISWQVIAKWLHWEDKRGHACAMNEVVVSIRQICIGHNNVCSHKSAILQSHTTCLSTNTNLITLNLDQASLILLRNREIMSISWWVNSDIEAITTTTTRADYTRCLLSDTDLLAKGRYMREDRGLCLKLQSSLEWQQLY